MKPNITGYFLGIVVVLTGWQTGLRSGLAQEQTATQTPTEMAETQTAATLSPTSQARAWAQAQAQVMGNIFRDDDASGASAAEATTVSAALTQKLTSKNAKVDDSVSAKTLSEARLSNGTRLPKGTKLLGHVTEVQAKGGAHHDGHIAFLYDRAVLRDGQEIPIHARLQSISAPAAATMTDNTDALYAGGVGGPVSPGLGGGRSTTGGGMGGGMMGSGSAVGSGSMPSTLGNGAPSTLGNAAGNVPSMVGGMGSDVQAARDGEVDQTAGIRVGSGAGAGAGAGFGTSVPMCNLPGVTANGSASSSANASGVLDGRGRNVDLGGGTQMVLAVTAQTKQAPSVE